MKLWIPKNRKELKQHLKDPLFKNSYFLMANTAVTSIFGFIFLIVVARSFETADVGLASALIAALGLLSILSNLGLGIGLIRFLPGAKDNGNSMINTCFTLSGLASVVIAIIFLAGLEFWSPALLPVLQHPTFFASFILFAIVWALNPLISCTFLAKRSTDAGMAMSVALLIAIFWFLPKIQQGYFPLCIVRRDVLNEISHYSGGNYIARIFLESSSLVLPLMVINILGAELSAYFCIAWSVTAILMVIPTSIFNSLFAEGSNEKETLLANTKKSLKLLLLLLLPAILILLVIADKVLLLFGQAYSQNGALLLRIIAVSIIPYSINYLYITIARVKMDIRGVIKVSVAITCLTLGLCYFLMLNMGLPGIGVGWLAGQSIVAIPVALYLLWRYYSLPKLSDESG
jgi:O-antigen/teichoic acid export membrane protein